MAHALDGSMFTFREPDPRVVAWNIVALTDGANLREEVIRRRNSGKLNGQNLTFSFCIPHIGERPPPRIRVVACIWRVLNGGFKG
jgi:hypothetical protein